jgi:hypothetical protein
VQYLHRTLEDYIEHPDVWNQICASTTSFSTSVSLFKAFALEIKGLDYSFSTSHVDPKELDDVLMELQCHIPGLVATVKSICATEGDWESDSFINYALDALNEIFTRMFSEEHSYDVGKGSLSQPILMALAVRYEVRSWVEELLERGHPTHSSWSGAPFIFISLDVDDRYTLPGMPLDMGWDRQELANRPSLNCLETLLAHGADPADGYLGVSPWDFALTKFVGILTSPASDKLPIGRNLEGDEFSGYDIDEYDGQYLEDWIQVVQIFTNHGASALHMLKEISQAFRKDLQDYSIYMDTTNFDITEAQKWVCGLAGVDSETFADQIGIDCEV